jgi:hypothetical protein
MPPDCLDIARAAMPVPNPAAPRPTDRALAPKPPARPPMIPPRPRSKLGDRVALNVIEDVKTSLITPIVVLRRPVVIDEVVTVDVLIVLPPPNPGAFRVENVPISATIDPVDMLEIFIVEALIKSTLIVEPVSVPKTKLDGNTKEEIDTVEKLPNDALILDVVIALVVILLVWIELITSGSGTTSPPPIKIDDTLRVDKTPALARTRFV